MPGKKTAEAAVALTLLVDRDVRRRSERAAVSVDLEKSHDRK